MSEIACTATMSAEAIKLNLEGYEISIPMVGDIDFTSLVKHLTNLVERENRIQMTWTESEQPTDKENVSKKVIDEIIDSFNQIIEEKFEEQHEEGGDIPF